MRSALSIAGSDPTGGAGLQADLQVFRSHGVHGGAVTTALTVQDTARVHQVLPVFPSVVLDQIRVLLADFVPSAVKIGMLATDDVVRSVSYGLAKLPQEVPVVIDPILNASDGSALLERRAIPALEELMTGRRLVTPNIPEAEILSGQDTSSRAGCERAAVALIEKLRCDAVLIKGGHRTDGASDLLTLTPASGSDTSLEHVWLEGERHAVDSVHGTGCALSAAITARLALGEPLRTAVEGARAFVSRAILEAGELGGGARIMSPPTLPPRSADARPAESGK